MASQTQFYLPPRYDLRGNRQLWFFETGNDALDNFGNGLLTAVLVVSIIAALGFLSTNGIGGGMMAVDSAEVDTGPASELVVVAVAVGIFVTIADYVIR
ncbi:hypothetical protein [Halobacterium hubeiense]|uniref:hypothetical protein n=1 Tax=Halobacterium hubeiense TaxID=1407499 RepID=UPI003C74A03E